ncbi:hypothetical protein AAK967_00075 [Atopobiaceae bacterium 24-176]
MSERIMPDLVRLPVVEAFSPDRLGDRKALAVKVLEEAAEVFGAWQNVYELNNEWDPWDYEIVLYECADVIQATVNLACAVVEDHYGDGGLRLDRVESVLDDAYVYVHEKNDGRCRYVQEPFSDR